MRRDDVQWCVANSARVPSERRFEVMLQRAIFRMLVTGLIIAAWAAAGNAATFELARRQDGIVVQGIKVEGEIVPGDAQKLLEFYRKYGNMISPVYLRSKGGDVAEAMKMGTIIRRLRLETSVPVWDTGRAAVDQIKVDHQENMVCASACFLAYAGGAIRFGNYLALHRPFLPREEARELSDAEYESAQKEMMPKVKAYLADMDIDQYWIDRMFSANSQEYYIPTWNEADNKVRRLMDMVPSLEEVVLSKCNEGPDAGLPPNAENQANIKQKMQDWDVFFRCRNTALIEMQSAAFERENDAILMEKCRPFPPLAPEEISTLKAFLRKGANVAPEEASVRIQLLEKADTYNQCKNENKLALLISVMKNWSDELGASKRAARPQTVNGSDANGLSSGPMAP